MRQHTNSHNILEHCRDAAIAAVSHFRLHDTRVIVTASALKPAEVIGTPRRTDYPILAGTEVMIEAALGNARGQAFTDTPLHYVGSLRDALALPLNDNGARAVFVATLNALYAHLGLINGTRHCKDDGPEVCAAEMARRAVAAGARTVGVIGFNPAIVAAMVSVFGAQHVRCSDLNPAVIGSTKSGVTILDGRTDNAALMRGVDLVLATGTTFVNDTAAALLDAARAAGTRLVFFGVTCAAVCHILQLERWCFAPENAGTPATSPTAPDQ